MEKLIVNGPTPLRGRVTISGSKNSSLPILAATLLTKEPCTIRRVPDLSDTNYMTQILAELGAEVERASGVVVVEAKKVKSVAPYDLVRKVHRVSTRRLRHRRPPGGFALEGARGSGCVHHSRWR
jgi:UDP-N-acetylglucosamine 1-carboxyvinyltransferase